MIESIKLKYLGVSLVALLACAVGCAAESSNGDDGGPQYPVGTGSTAATGSAAGVGGYTSGTGSTTGAGGVTTGTGSTTGAGGVATGTGGTSGGTVTCGTTPGINAGYYDNGTMCGFAWTGTNKNAGAEIPGTSIAPACGTSTCFTGTTICAEGDVTIPKNAPPAYSGVMIGWNVAQSADGTVTSTYAASGTGITPTFTATGATGEIRVIVQSGGSDYCAVATSGTAIPWSSFKTECWTGGVTQTPLPAGAPITAILIQVNGSDAGDQTLTAFCLDSITNN